MYMIQKLKLNSYPITHEHPLMPRTALWRRYGESLYYLIRVLTLIHTANCHEVRWFLAATLLFLDGIFARLPRKQREHIGNFFRLLWERNSSCRWGLRYNFLWVPFFLLESELPVAASPTSPPRPPRVNATVLHPAVSSLLERFLPRVLRSDFSGRSSV